MIKLYVFTVAVVVFPFLNALCDAQFGHDCYMRRKLLLGNDLWHWAKRLWWNGLWVLALQPYPIVPDCAWHWKFLLVFGWILLGSASWDLGAHVGGKPEWGILKLRRRE